MTRRLFQTLRETLGTGTELSEVLKGVNPGVVTIAPAKLKCIIPHSFYACAFQAGRYVAMDDFTLAGEFLHTSGARTILAQIPGLIRTEMSVVPMDIRSFRIHPLHK